MTHAQNLDTIGSNLYAAFPQLGVIEPLRLLGVGFRSIVVETGGIVFRIAKNSDHR